MSFDLALKEIERHVKVYKAFEEAQHALTALASLEQNTKELEASKAVLALSVQDTQADLKLKQIKLKEINDKIARAEEVAEATLKEVEARKLAELEARYVTLANAKEEQITSLSVKVASLAKTILEKEALLKTKEDEVLVMEQRALTAREQIQKLLNGSL